MKPGDFSRAMPRRPLRDEDAADREWWTARVAGWRALAPSLELAHLHGAMVVLTGRHPMQNGRFHPRPQIERAVAERIAELEAAGVSPIDLERMKQTRPARPVALEGEIVG